MMKALEVKKDIYWVGSLDPELRVFDVIMYTPYGTTYNSYVVKGSEKTAIFETVKEKTFEQYLERLKSINVNFEEIAYIVVDHTEPDHAGSVAKLLDYAVNAKVVGSAPAIRFLRQIANRPFQEVIVKHGDTLSLGDKTLRFIEAPFLHWPDSIYTYVEEDHVLMTCDSFGSHYCFDEMFRDMIPAEKENEYMDALKYYYDCIMGPFKPYVLKALDKIKDLEIDTICTGHGPILRGNIDFYREIYRKWSTEDAPADGKTRVVIPYVSAYGFTEQLANSISQGIKSKIEDAIIEPYNVIEHKQEEILDKIYWADAVLFGSPTINGDALYPILDILIKMNPLVHGGKVAAAFGSFGWSGEAVPNIEARLKALRMKLVTPGLKINFKPNEDELQQAYKFGETVAEKIKENISKGVKTLRKSNLKIWKCIVCGEEFESEKAPEVCPACGATKEQFVEVKKEEVEFKQSKKEKYLIIGNGAAGYYAADSIRKRNAEADINMVSSEKVLTYYKPQLSDYISKDIADKRFFVAPEDYYAKNNIKVTLGVRVEKINKDKNTVSLDNGTELSYDKLILATGASNFLPPIKGYEKKGVYVLRDLEDGKKIKEEMKHAKNAVVVGGGLLGLEAAWEMKNAGMNVSVVELVPNLLSLQLDKEGSELFEKTVAEAGINILTGECAGEVLGEGSVNGLKLKSGKTIEADLVLFSVGIRPNVCLAKESGIEVNKGIIVNEKMQTNIENIYACGDNVELNGRIYGNWPAATEMGKVAGANAVGDEAEFKDFVNSIVFNAINSHIFSVGEVKLEAGVEVLSSANPDKKIYKKLFFKDKKLVGGILMGDTKKSIKLLKSIQANKLMADVLKEDILA
ncbi:FAD-dependent oxidoreductase [Clostridium swellfunianum]|uniref:FAD-dependent oxidoreductase n=1 Tax=Clostridium swellfunianum TaxID=1367462 RepID=UPI00202F7A65|nr:FAD-dependent oxidoreductase [Clostridium swellfunianum]MCM0647398.1 FAD-dependent oxidoreductase [Clostridium swellfunianum]